jgi:Na+/H+-dicarboxylate symporter
MALLRHFNDRNLTIALTTGIIGGIILGLAAQRHPGTPLDGAIDFIQIFATLFLSTLKMVVVPLVLVSVTNGVANLHGGGEAGRKLGKILIYFLATSFLAVLVGMLFTNVIEPGAGRTAQSIRESLPSNALASAEKTQGAVAMRAPKTIGEFVELQIGNLFQNPFAAMAQTNLIGVVAFSMLLGLMLLYGGEKARPVREVLGAFDDALMRMVRVIIWAGPPGVLALAANLFRGLGPEVFAPLSRYFLTVVLALGTHLFIVFPLVLILVCRYSPRRFFMGMREAMLLAVSTSSSAATMPATLRCTEEHLGVDRKDAEFVIPMGATINMNGTALYEAVAAMFVAQVLGMELTILQQMLVFLTATLAAIGAAGVPQAGLVTMVIVFNAIGLPLEWMALIIVVDRPLDHLRTVVNIVGDAVGAVFLSGSERACGGAAAAG